MVRFSYYKNRMVFEDKDVKFSSVAPSRNKKVCSAVGFSRITNVKVYKSHNSRKHYETMRQESFKIDVFQSNFINYLTSKENQP